MLYDDGMLRFVWRRFSPLCLALINATFIWDVLAVQASLYLKLLPGDN